MLEILSDNRNLRGHIKEAEKMLTQIDITPTLPASSGMAVPWINPRPSTAVA